MPNCQSLCDHRGSQYICNSPMLKKPIAPPKGQSYVQIFKIYFEKNPCVSAEGHTLPTRFLLTSSKQRYLRLDGLRSCRHSPIWEWGRHHQKVNRASIIFTHYQRTDSRELAVVLHVLSFLFPCLFVLGNVTAGDWPQQPAATYGGLRQREWALLQLSIASS